MVALALATAPLLAGPRSDADEKTFGAALAKGRALEVKGKHADAITAFQAALKIDADDATALAELGLVQYVQKDLPAAEATMRQAVLHAPDGTYPGDPAARIRSAALYNLAKIQTDRGDTAGAIVTYRDAAKVRATRAVRSELAKLDRDAAAALDPFAPARLSGPFESIAAACTDSTVRNGFGKGDQAKTQCEHPTTFRYEGRGKPPSPAPIRDLVLFVTDDRTELDIAVKLDAGWYVSAITDTRDRCRNTELRWKAATDASTAGHVRLHVEYTSTGSCSHDGMGHTREWGWSQRVVVAIGIGASGVPSATPPVFSRMTEWQRTDDQSKLECTDIALVPTWGKDDALQIAGKLHDCWTPALDTELVLGAHALSYP